MEKKSLILHYPFDETENPLKNEGINKNPGAALCGPKLPYIEEKDGRKGLTFCGGKNGTSYVQLPEDILQSVSDEDGLTVAAWVNLSKAGSVWERIVDFGRGDMGPYMFLTRMLHGECLSGSPMVADCKAIAPENEWIHVVFSVLGTKGGTLSSAGPRVYLNGELAGDGLISQTSSGTYLKLRNWFEEIGQKGIYTKNYLGHSQFAADGDLAGTISDFRLYNTVLEEADIIDLMCESLTDKEIVNLAADKYLKAPSKIITNDIVLPESLMEGRVQVKWDSSKPKALDGRGKKGSIDEADFVVLTASLSCGSESTTKSFEVTVLPSDIAPYELNINADKTVLNISKTLYGLFFEDINHSADGGIYAEMIQNRSFEEFEYEIYDHRSGENGKGAGRKHDPLKYWFGTLDKVRVKNKGGLRDFFCLKDRDANAYYIEADKGCVLQNRGFCDNRMKCAMPFYKGEKYDFSIWAKGAAGGKITVALYAEDGTAVSEKAEIEIEGTDWKKYFCKDIEAFNDATGYIEISFSEKISADMISLFPQKVWGSEGDGTSKSAHENYRGNPNYRLRRDLVQTLYDMHPRFLRFPGGCISEGSYIWDNVYDWKDSVGDVEIRKENYNVWGYTMTLGLGYMEYFQLAEDLGAEPLPVMACGVLCQARSDYANPAGGALRDKYISNFVDLIDFAIGQDFNNKWAALRREMGHPKPFDLHLLGVGNENWGPEFYANFELFENAIREHMDRFYPGYELTIVSTAGAQADDEAYEEGWRYLLGLLTQGREVAFTDGESSTQPKLMTWYKYKPDYLDTIVDEHYYRDNNYLLENVDRYTYYNRTYNGKWADEAHMPKVFVGEYASNEKNTLAGAVAEAATMIGYERNSDVVRLASTAPLFNQPGEDGTYRWTPDCIWFDQEKIWLTPTYHVQKLFASNIGTRLVETSYSKYEKGELRLQKQHGGILIETEGDVDILTVRVYSAVDNLLLYEQDFAKGTGAFVIEKDNEATFEITESGLKVRGGRLLMYDAACDFERAVVKVLAIRRGKESYVCAGLGLRLLNGSFSKDSMDLHEYCVGDGIRGTGLKVFKEGVEGYALGDYSCGYYAGNLRKAYLEDVPVDEKITLSLNLGGRDGDTLSCHYEKGDGLNETSAEHFAEITTRLDAYDKELFSSVTRDEDYLYIKLVNASEESKKVRINIKNDANDKVNNYKGYKYTVSGNAETAHIPNITTKSNSAIDVKEKEAVLGSEFAALIDAVSVNVYKIKL